MLSDAKYYRANPMMLVRLWVHECHRVYLDRLIMPDDIENYMAYLKVGCKQFEFNTDNLLETPLVYTNFVKSCQGHDKVYMPIEDYAELKKVLEAKLEEYNENMSQMNLVLFEQAMEHIVRISRIIDQPNGNALLVGVGGSGKQSLSKLTAYILGYDVMRIMVASNYGMDALKQDLQTMYTKAGVQGAQMLFILTDSQIAQDKFLVYINDILSSGWIADLYPKEDMDTVLGKVRGEAKSAGYQDTPDQLFEFFLDKVRKNFHIALCFSPVGEAFRIRARMFPGIINCTSMDWFHEWPRGALIDVAEIFLGDIEFPEDDLKSKIAVHMATVHMSISEANDDYLEQERRFNYTTPTSFLELISFYRKLLTEKRDKITDQINRLEIGLQTMDSTTEQVDGLKQLLVIKMADVEVEKEKTGKLIDIVTEQNAIAEKEQEDANV